jgi:hypothetical protein
MAAPVPPVDEPEPTTPLAKGPETELGAFAPVAVLVVGVKSEL